MLILLTLLSSLGNPEFDQKLSSKKLTPLERSMLRCAHAEVLKPAQADVMVSTELSPLDAAEGGFVSFYEGSDGYLTAVLEQLGESSRTTSEFRYHRDKLQCVVVTATNLETIAGSVAAPEELYWSRTELFVSGRKVLHRTKSHSRSGGHIDGSNFAEESRSIQAIRRLSKKNRGRCKPKDCFCRFDDTTETPKLVCEATE